MDLYNRHKMSQLFAGRALVKVVIETFPDGEIGARILESVRGRDVFVLQTIARRPSFYLLELFILVDALKRSSARSINAVIPYFGYARQDRRRKEGEAAHSPSLWQICLKKQVFLVF